MCLKPLAPLAWPPLRLCTSPAGAYLCDVTVKNTGNVQLSNLGYTTNTSGTSIGCPAALAAGASAPCKYNATGALTQALFEAGPLSGWVSTVTVKDSLQNVTSAVSDTTVPIYTPKVTITIVADKAQLNPAVPTDVKYTVTITNPAPPTGSSNTAWNSTSLVITSGGVTLAVTCPMLVPPVGGTLALGGTAVCTATKPAVLCNTAGPLVATATINVVAVRDPSKTASATASVSTPCVVRPARPLAPRRPVSLLAWLLLLVVVLPRPSSPPLLPPPLPLARPCLVPPLNPTACTHQTPPPAPRSRPARTTAPAPATRSTPTPPT